MRRTPCSWLLLPKHFGRRPDAEFHLPHSALDRAAATAARLQHQVALAVRDALDTRSLPLSHLAATLGENTDHLRRKLHGKATASLADLAAWVEVLNLPGFSLRAEHRAPARADEQVHA